MPGTSISGPRRLPSRGIPSLGKSFSNVFALALAASIAAETASAISTKEVGNLMAQSDAAVHSNTAIQSQSEAASTDLTQGSPTWSKHGKPKNLAQTHTHHHHHKAKAQEELAQTKVEEKPEPSKASLLAQIISALAYPQKLSLAQQAGQEGGTETSGEGEGGKVTEDSTGMSHWLQERPYLLIILAIANVVGCCFCSQILLRFSKQCNLELNRYYIKKRFEKQKMMTNTIQQTRLLRQQQNRTRRLQEERGGQLILEQDEYADEPEDRHLELDLEPNMREEEEEEEEEEE